MIAESAAAAEPGDLTFGALGKKTAEPLAGPGEYEITVSVPGAVSTEGYNEVIVMVDASTSQSGNFENLKTMLLQLGKTILREDGSMRLTLMGFGFGPRTAVTFVRYSTMEERFALITQDDLMQGRSATNCEGAFAHIEEYINNSPDLLETFVIFTSDGGTNMDDTPIDFTTWTEHPEWYFQGWDVVTIASYIAGTHADYLVSGGKTLGALSKVYPEQCVRLELARATGDTETYSAIVDELYNAITADTASATAFINAVWSCVFEEAGMTFAPGYLYPARQVEKAFIDYYRKYVGEDSGLFGSFCDSFYVLLMNLGYSLPDHHSKATKGARAAAACDRVSAMDKVKEVYLIGYSGTGVADKSWMNPDSTSYAKVVNGDNATYLSSKDYPALIQEVTTLGQSIAQTVYSNVTVTDPMSKWVDLDPDSIRIYLDDTLIYQYGQGWLIDNPPTAEEPITITPYGEDNYQITWKIKDGPLLYTDRYYLKYHVAVDETVDGFQSGAAYPANDPTKVTYTDENGNPQEEQVTVPDVSETIDSFGDEDLGLQIFKLSAGDHDRPISGIRFSLYTVTPEEGETITPIPTEAAIAKYQTAEHYVTTITTDGHGYASYNFTANGFGEGIYLVVEEASDKVLAPVAPFYIQVPMADPESDEENPEVTNIVQVYPKNTPVETPPETPDEPDIPVNPGEEKEGILGIVKHAQGDSSELLSGAVFAVYRLAQEGETPSLTTEYNGSSLDLVLVTTMTTGEDGMAAVRLPYGLYFLQETQAPEGYYLSDEIIPVMVTDAGTDPARYTWIPNSTGPLLPETGGMGTTLFTVAGALLVLLSGVCLITKKRMSV